MEKSVFGPAMKKFAEKLPLVQQKKGLREATKKGYSAVLRFAKKNLPIDLHFDLRDAWEDDNPAEESSDNKREKYVFGPALTEFAKNLTLVQQTALREAVEKGHRAAVEFVINFMCKDNKSEVCIPVHLAFDLVDAWETDNQKDWYDQDWK